MPLVLVVDDEKNLRSMLRSLLEGEQYLVKEAASGDAALSTCQEVEPDVILMDLVMEPGPDGIDVLERLAARQCDAPVIMMSGKASLHDAVRATRLGAFQFLEKPLSPEAVLTTVRAALELAYARSENRALRSQLPESQGIVGGSAAIGQVRELVAQVAPTTSRVLITGESGTGKELVARAVHRQSPRGELPLVCVNCAAVPRELLESEMFGHERGAFTGAVARRRGKFELADRSTLFLDEVADMPLDAQAKLLRVLETGTIERVGGDRERTVDVRVIAATNKDLQTETTSGRFREDLLYRLRVFPIDVPPLRQRKEDVAPLVAHCARLAAAKCARRPRSYTAGALKRLELYDWPGNVRELANLVERLTIVGGDGPVEEDEVSRVLPPTHAGKIHALGSPGMGLNAALDSYESDLIRGALADAHGNVAKAARILRTDRANLYRRMRRLGLGRSDTGVSD